jgi:lipopolysaccharide export system protein LptA
VARSKGGERGFSLPGSRARGPIHIDADVLEFDARQEIATFRGSVVTTQDDVVMRSALLRVTFASGGGEEGRSLERLSTVVAEGDVEIQQGDRVARGARAEFNDAERTVVLTGGAVLHDGPSEVRGDRVVVYLDEERSVVEGRNTRVKAILVPDGSKRAEEPSPAGDTARPEAAGPGTAEPAVRADDAP